MIPDGYEKIKVVGKGTFGTATLFRRVADKKLIVFKEILTLNLDNNEKKSALNEIEVISTLNHPNIIRYLGNFKREDSFIIMMEYADGGNLAQLLNAKRESNGTFTERGILTIVSQITGAISYMHGSKILHRDLKTANIFLTLNGMIKVGDFGISKMLNTKSQAQTVVGTPYYLSPEMCEGMDYNEKSDVWAIGCILYELTALKRPFDAQTLPVLIKRITICDYEDIPGIYSKELSKLVHMILQKNFEIRPSAKLMHDYILPKILKNCETVIPLIESEMSKERSIVYEIWDFNDDLQVTPMDLPHKKFVHLASSSTHQIAIASDNSIYVWGENNYGQLGLGVFDSRRNRPTFLKTVNQVKFVSCLAGSGFSLFLSERGLIYSCGNGSSGVLGHGDCANYSQLTVIGRVLQEKFVTISCGNHHAAGITSEGKVYTWGSSKYGELGQGSIQQSAKPVLLNLQKKFRFSFCGTDATILYTFDGELYASGKNGANKLGLGKRIVSFNFFTKIKYQFPKLQRVSIMDSCTMILNGSFLLVLGNNLEHPQNVQLNNITMLSTGSEFIAATDRQNVLWFWGSYKKYQKHNSFISDKTFTKFNSIVSLVQSKDNSVKKFNEENSLNDFTVETVREPMSILALYSSKENVKQGNMIEIGDIKANDNSIFLLVNTTVKPPVVE